MERTTFRPIRSLLLLLLALTALTVSALADNAPKPQLTVLVENPPQETYYLDLVAEGPAGEEGDALSWTYSDQEIADLDPALLSALTAAVPSGPAAPNGAWLRVVTRDNPPPFSFWRPKKKTAVEPSKEKTLVAAQLRARDAPCRAAGRGAKPFCSVKVMPAGARAGLSADFRTQCAVLHSAVVGQRLNLTSCSFRAQSAAREVAAVPASFRRGRCLHRPVAGTSVDLP